MVAFTVNSFGSSHPKTNSKSSLHDYCKTVLKTSGLKSPLSGVKKGTQETRQLL